MTSLRGRLGVAIGAGVAVLAGLVFFARSSASTGPTAADVSVSCGFGQRAVVKQTISAGTPHVAVDCVHGSAVQAGYPVDPYGNAPQYGPVVSGAMPAVVPAVYTPQVADRSFIAQAPPVRRVSTSAARSSSVRARNSASWQRRALVIGGSTGVGAGVGALVGGKKGALIGAAIGGGGAALVQAARRN